MSFDAPMESVSDKNQKRPSLLVLALFSALILLFAGLLRVWNLPTQSVDGDEMFSRRVALAPPQTALKLVEDDLVHPPLYYFLLKGIVPLAGAGADGIRSLSLACGLGAILVVLSWGIVIPQLRGATFLAAVLLALNRTDIFFSQQARSYALYGLWVCLLLLWYFATERYGERLWFWIVGAALMACLLYTHYVGELFLCAVGLSALTIPISPRCRVKMIAAIGAANLAFAPWLLAEAGVYRAKHGLGSNLSWESLPTGYELRAVWASFNGLPQYHGGTVLSLSIGILLAGFGIYRAFRRGDRSLRGPVTVLAFTAILPPMLLFATSLKPLSLHVFGERHLLPAIYPSLMLVAQGLAEMAAVSSRKSLVWAAGIVCLCGLQIAEWCSVGFRSGREPYMAIARDLAKAKNESVYSTWPYGIGAPVNFYLGTDRVWPLPSGETKLPEEFVVLYRPGLADEKKQVDALMKEEAGRSLRECRYYADGDSTFGTRMCTVAAAQH